MFSDNIEGSLRGGLASGIPGEVRGLEYLHKAHGTLPWSELLQPSIHIARSGHVITRDLANAMDNYATDGFLVSDPAWAVDFAPDGARLGEGDLLIRKRLADLLEGIAAKGAEYFYTGDIAVAIVQALQASGGIMTMADLANYGVTVREPLQIEYREYKITSCGAPSSGAVVLQTMKTVEGYSNFDTGDLINLDTHRLDEAVRFGYGARTLLGDPTFVENVTAYEHNMIHYSTAAEIRSRISDEHTLPVSAYNPLGLESLETPGTSHLSVADASGMAIALTSTVNLDFGSKLMVPEIGVIMNNEMNDFSIPNSTNSFGYIPSAENFVQPGKRPQSSMSPTIVEFLSNNSLYFAVGADGGSRIVTAVIQALWHVLDHGSTSLDAVSSPRFHDQLVPNQSVCIKLLAEDLMAESASLPPHRTTESQDPQALLDFLNRYSTVKFIRLQWLDYSNMLRCRVLTKPHLTALVRSKQFYAVGIGFLTLLENSEWKLQLDPSEAVGQSRLVPDWESLRLCSWVEGHACVQCFLGKAEINFDERGHGQIGFDKLCPRSALQAALWDAKQLGLEFEVGFETEFCVSRQLADGSVIQLPQGTHYPSSMRTLEGVMLPIMDEIVSVLEVAGISVLVYHAEGQRDQYEIVTKQLSPMQAADAVVHTREVIRNVCTKHSLVATFHPWTPVTNGAHVNISLVNGPACATALEERFMAGILEHLGAIFAFGLPLPVSYQRVVPGQQAFGRYIAWGTQNRETPVRKKGPAFWELRFVDAAANVYLVLAAIFRAGSVGAREQAQLTLRDCQGRIRAIRMFSNVPCLQTHSRPRDSFCARAAGPGNRKRTTFKHARSAYIVT
ncbi:MAG: hypothetical protein Q9160_003651 [Pyrenula sp. 1 TL-2023]